MWVNWNGALQLQEAIAFDSRDRGYLLGDGLFETIGNVYRKVQKR